MSTKKSPTELGSFLGEELTVRKMKHRVVIKNRPRMKRGAPSAKQEAVLEKFQQAAVYASRQNKLPDAQQFYAKGINKEKRSLYLVALSDYLQAPKVLEVKAEDYLGAVGDLIFVRAIDDFKVVRVRVVIKGRDGKQLEQGDAIPDEQDPNLWRYTATVANPRVEGSTIVATAYDKPRNEGVLEKVL